MHYILAAGEMNYAFKYKLYFICNIMTFNWEFVISKTDLLNYYHLHLKTRQKKKKKPPFEELVNILIRISKYKDIFGSQNI